MDSQTTQEIKKKKKWLLPVILGVAALLVIGIGVGGFIYIKSVALPKKEVQRNLDLGDKYLTEMDYDNAIVAYKAAIDIDPKCENAYLGLGRTYKELAEECIENGEISEAIDYLQDGIKSLKAGYSNTNSDAIKELLDELKEKKKELEEEPETEAVFASIDTANLPDGLEAFLANLQWLSGYDCESEERVKYLTLFMMSVPYVACDFSWYSDYCKVPGYDEIWNYGYEENGGYYVDYDADGIDWILKNIYNVSDNRLSKLKESGYFSDSGNDNGYKDGKYHFSLGGVGGGYTAYVDAAETDGKLYHISYRVEDCYSEGIYENRYAILEYKIIDGKGYWSVYQESDSPLFNMNEVTNSEPPEVTSQEEAGNKGAITDGNLINMARKWCEANNNGSSPEYVEIDGTQGNNVTIHLYDVVIDDEVTGAGHTATWYWLTIDRTTGKGTDDVFGDPVDLSPYQ